MSVLRAPAKKIPAGVGIGLPQALLMLCMGLQL